MTDEARHGQQSIENGIHSPIAYEFDNSVARLAAGPFLESDKNKFAKQLDTGEIWMLEQISPIMWVQLSASARTLSEVLYQGNLTDGYDILVFPGDAINGVSPNPYVTIQGVKNYPTSATDPTTPTPAAGDMYYNSAIEEDMRYDGTRSKWLSKNDTAVGAGRNGNTNAGSFYRAYDGMILDAVDRGVPVQKGTLTYVGWSRTDNDSATLDILVNGVSIATLNSTVTGLTENAAINVDFDGGLMSFQNQNGGGQTSNVQIRIVYKRRV